MVSPIGSVPRVSVSPFKRLFNPDVIRSLPFRKVACGVLNYGGVHPEIIKFANSFRDDLWAEGMPFYCCGLAYCRAQFTHYLLGDDLNFEEREFFVSLGERRARKFDMEIAVDNEYFQFWYLR